MGCAYPKATLMSSVIARKLDSLKKAGAMNITDVANILGTTPATVSRWSNGKASPQRSKELLLVELEYIVDRLQDFYTPEEGCGCFRGIAYCMTEDPPN